MSRLQLRIWAITLRALAYLVHHANIQSRILDGEKGKERLVAWALEEQLGDLAEELENLKRS